MKLPPFNRQPAEKQPSLQKEVYQSDYFQMVLRLCLFLYLIGYLAVTLLMPLILGGIYLYQRNHRRWQNVLGTVEHERLTMAEQSRERGEALTIMTLKLEAALQQNQRLGMTLVVAMIAVISMSFLN